jgi:hypothetical protein
MYTVLITLTSYCVRYCDLSADRLSGRASMLLLIRPSVIDSIQAAAAVHVQQTTAAEMSVALSLCLKLSCTALTAPYSNALIDGAVCTVSIQ